MYSFIYIYIYIYVNKFQTRRIYLIRLKVNHSLGACSALFTFSFVSHFWNINNTFVFFGIGLASFTHILLISSELLMREEL